jgi:ligand-binding sensor domain-containing protein/tRNA A-37 threonylcarbamoyl transferase component Bud32
MDSIVPGQNLGPYRIIQRVGQGGMATVYKAYHAAMDRYVAVKVLPRQLAEQDEFTGRFRQEARTIARLEHPHILPVYDYGESEGINYLVMRFLDAGSLKSRLSAGPLTFKEIDRLFTQLAEALGYAHDNGVIHRDLKPANVLVDAGDNVFLTDFGIAKILESTSHFTSTGALIGTPAYMSPEQAQGQRADRRSDIYSLGIMLYEMVIGKVPFEAETPLAILLKHINEPLPLPTVQKADLPLEIERVILKALAKDPADRFATAAEFIAAWKAALAQADTLRVSAAAEPAPPPAAAPPAAPMAAPAATVMPAAASTAVPATPTIAAAIPTGAATPPPAPAPTAAKAKPESPATPPPLAKPKGSTWLVPVLVVGGLAIMLLIAVGGLFLVRRIRLTAQKGTAIVAVTQTLAAAMSTAEPAAASPTAQPPATSPGKTPVPAATGLPASVLYSQDFESGAPPEWKLDEGWSVVPAEEGHALSGQGHAWARLTLSFPLDSSMAMRIQAGEGTLHMSLRERPAEGGFDRYFVALSKDSVVLHKQMGDKFSDDLANAPGLGSGWHKVEVLTIGQDIIVFVDGQKVIRYADPEPLPAGQYSLEALTDQPVLVDQVVVSTAKGQTPPEGQGPWRSWAGGKLVYAVELYKNTVFAGGPGGLTLWNRETGALVRRFTTADGLPSAYVNALLVNNKTSELVIGTSEGLAVLSEADTTLRPIGKDRPYVSALALAADGSMIVGTQYTEAGAGLYILRDQELQPIPNFPSGDEGQPDTLSYNILCLATDPRQSALWVGTDRGLGRLLNREWTRFTTADGLPSDVILSVLVDRQGVLWVGTSNGAARYDPQTQKFAVVAEIQQFMSGDINSVDQDNLGTYWFAGDGGIARLNPRSQEWTFLNQDSAGQPVYVYYFGTVPGLHVGEDMFFGSSVGLVRFDMTGKFQNWVVPDVPWNGSFDMILPEPGGGLWLRSDWGGGVDYLDTTAFTWMSDPHAYCECWPLSFDREGNLWGARWDRGLAVFSKETEVKILTTEQGLPHSIVLAVAFDDKGQAWIGTEAGLAVLPPGGGQITEVFTAANSGFAEDIIRNVFAATDGSIWVTTGQTLSRRRPDDGQWEHFAVGNPFTEDLSDITGIGEHPQGQIWVTTRWDGLYHWNAGEWQHFTPQTTEGKLPFTGFNSVTPAGDSVWFGSTEGAVRYDGQTWTIYTPKDGLIQPWVEDIYVDPKGVIWFATRGGLTRYGP